MLWEFQHVQPFQIANTAISNFIRLICATSLGPSIGAKHTFAAIVSGWRMILDPKIPAESKRFFFLQRIEGVDELYLGDDLRHHIYIDDLGVFW